MKRYPKLLAVLVVLIVTGGGGYYVLHRSGHQHDPAEGGKQAAGKVQYTCPMHPFIVKDQPGTCPICNMELVKKTEGAQATPAEQAKLGEVALSPTQQVIANVATYRVDRQQLSKEITAVGSVAYDQSRQAKVTTWVAGRLDRLMVNTVGETVGKGTAVAELYSPDLVAAQQEYLLALKSREQFKNSPFSAIAQGGEGLVAAARQRLKLMGVRDEQIAGLEKAGEPSIRLAIYTPLAGVVIEKLVQQGQYVNVGEPLFAIADLSKVWVELDIFESDLALVKVGQRVEVMPQSYPGKVMNGRVALINPFLDPKTRTVKVRVELANSGLLLKPEMFVNARLTIPLGNVLAVPVTAVQDTGTRQLVWVKTRPDAAAFAPREVKVGARVGGLVQVVSGLLRGDTVAAAGSYLIDSEAQLRGGAPGEHSQHTGSSGGQQPDSHQGHGPAAPAPGKKPMDMNDMKM
ncbi:MAG TPA: efflux RND transporter periplasmic adaptor subunit [Geobacteraceae bacterium]